MKIRHNHLPSLKTTWLVFVIVSFFPSAKPLHCQQQAEKNQSSVQESSRKPDLTMRVKVVNVPSVVRDKHGHLVNALVKDDFILEEDGRPQQVRYFSHDADLSVILGLLMDTSLSQRRVLDQERHASYTFLDHILRQPKDAAFLIHFDHEVELLQDLTSSREKLQSALQALQTPRFTQTSGGGSPSQSPGGGRRGGPGRDSQRGTLLYDAVFLASDELLKKQEGRKALLILSDGVDRRSKETMDNAIASAQRTDTVIYSILFADEERGSYGGYAGGMGRRSGGRRGRFPQESRPDGKKALQRMAKETGGRFFEVSKKQTVEKIYEAISEELRSQYSLGYTPDRVDLAQGYHKIHLTTKQKDLTVQARDGYYLDR